jgi:hypothetical protein
MEGSFQTKVAIGKGENIVTHQKLSIPKVTGFYASISNRIDMRRHRFWFMGQVVRA